MFPGKLPGSRTLQGLTVKAQIEKLCPLAVREREFHTEAANRHWRVKTRQNLVSAIVLTIASTVAVIFALEGPPRRWSVLGLVVTAMLCNLVLVTRRHGEKEKAHRQLAKRYAVFEASCRASVAKYEEGLVEDSGLLALLDQHQLQLEALKKEPEPA